MDFAFSPDEKYLYVRNWVDNKKIVMRYRISDDGTATESKLFFDMTAAPGEDAIDGIKVDTGGNIYVSGPGGLWILSPEGKHLGTIVTPKHPHNFAWGGDDGRTLYLCARSGLYRMPLNIARVRPCTQYGVSRCAEIFGGNTLADTDGRPCALMLSKSCSAAGSNCLLSAVAAVRSSRRTTTLSSTPQPPFAPTNGNLPTAGPLVILTGQRLTWG